MREALITSLKNILKSSNVDHEGGMYFKVEMIDMKKSQLCYISMFKCHDKTSLAVSLKRLVLGSVLVLGLAKI